MAGSSRLTGSPKAFTAKNSRTLGKGRELRGKLQVFGDQACVVADDLPSGLRHRDGILAFELAPQRDEVVALVAEPSLGLITGPLRQRRTQEGTHVSPRIGISGTAAPD